jgi:tRNA threonylcarbamoyladenosine biosynthesis protein TsaE
VTGESESSEPGETITTGSPDETFDLGRALGGQLQGREVVLLTGELGAGKTLFTKGVAAGIGIDPADVTSPSFTLVNSHQGRLRLYHVDLYRLASSSSIDLGLEEIFAEHGAVTVIEWAERLDISPPDAIKVRIESVSESERRITIWGGHLIRINVT